MDDEQIVALYWARDERALSESERRYGAYCRRIALNILYSPEDAEEAVNDTWLGAWNAMPPHRPSVLSAFLGKITRRVSLKRWRAAGAQKRGGGQAPLALEELMDCISQGPAPEETLGARELAALIDAFLGQLPKTERQVFVRRYWYLDSVADICTRLRFSKSKVESMLYRTRRKLRAKLEQEGVVL